MAANKKVILTCAVTGSAHTPTMSEGLPFTVEDIVAQSVAAAEAGASIIHLHARDPRDGRPTPDPEIFLDYLRPLKEASDVIVSMTSGGGAGMTMKERTEAIIVTNPELSTFSLGSMNFGLYGMIPKYQGSWRYDWEESYLESTRREPFINTYEDMEYMLREVGPTTGSRFEFEAYDIGGLYTLADYLDAGLVEPPVFLQTCLGVVGGTPAEVDHLVHLKQTADRLLGDAFEWSVLGGGRQQFNIVTAAATMGAHVRVGLEDSLYLRRGQLAMSNAEQVAKMVRILNELSLEVATPAEAREILGLKGLEKVGW